MTINDDFRAEWDFYFLNLNQDYIIDTLMLTGNITVVCFPRVETFCVYLYCFTLGYINLSIET